ncbi:MAG: hypothetical protein VXX79_19020, partial [Pseudomonadota bacterium]|nr:hypothetical protein [Pseudomonadota bacterium]
MANQTPRATEDIRVQVKEIREATNNAVVAIDQISETDTEVEHISGTIEEAVGQQGDTLDGIRDLKTSVMAVVRESTSSNYGNGEQTQDESAETSHETTADDDHVSDEIEEGAVA